MRMLSAPFFIERRMLMQDFFYSIPTKIAFGKDELKKLPEFVKEFGERAIIVYGGGSIKRSGLYDEVVKLFTDNNIKYCELGGVEPNPTVETVNKGINICRENNIDIVIPIGGGSTIDCGKAIAAGVKYIGEVWDLIMDSDLIREALPIIAIPTMAATGSEMDPFGVITNKATVQKMDIYSELLYPKYSILNPENTFTVSAYQTAAGVADIMSHIFEVYFNGVKGTYMQDRIMEGLLKTCVKYGPIAVKEPDNYEARANLMWASEWAINGFIACGKSGPWPAHSIEHQLSAEYNVTHGHGLAIIVPVLMKHILNIKSLDVFVNYGVNVFGISEDKAKFDIANEAIDKTRALFEEMGLSSTLRSIGIENRDRFSAMAAKAALEGLDECMVPLDKEDVIKIYELSF